jgi:hypothetical protein
MQWYHVMDVTKRSTIQIESEGELYDLEASPILVGTKPLEYV